MNKIRFNIKISDKITLKKKNHLIEQDPTRKAKKMCWVITCLKKRKVSN